MKGKTLKELRESVNMTQADVAEKLDKTITYISLLENGKRNPSDKLKEQLSKIYKVSISDIFLSIKLTKC